MEIWIRSQDKKTLIFASHIYIDMPVNGNQICGISGIDSFVVLGKYITGERALQILDEIQQFIIDCHQCKNDKMFSPVFNMPAE
jgi:hypothetical protein